MRPERIIPYTCQFFSSMTRDIQTACSRPENAKKAGAVLCAASLATIAASIALLTLFALHTNIPIHSSSTAMYLPLAKLIGALAATHVLVLGGTYGLYHGMKKLGDFARFDEGGNQIAILK